MRIIHIFSVSIVLLLGTGLYELVSAKTTTTLPIHQRNVSNISIGNRIGVNYYHESMGYYGRTAFELDDDLFEISKVTNKIKLYHHPWGATSTISTICRTAKEKGLHVVWTENLDGNGLAAPNWVEAPKVLTALNWDEYRERVLAAAASAKDCGADEFLVGNELSLHTDKSGTFGDTNLPILVKNLVRDARAVFPGKIGYEDGWWKKDSWYLAGLGDMDYIYFTLYESLDNFEKHLIDIKRKFGYRARIGEFSYQTSAAENQKIVSADMLQRRNLLLTYRMDAYVFTFSEATNSNFSLFNRDTQKPFSMWYAVYND